MIINNSKLKIKDSQFYSKLQIQNSPKESLRLPTGQAKFRIFNLKSSIKNNKGLTLLEIAMSMAILAIALVALSSLFPIGLKFSRRASTFSEASILAQRVIENIKRAAAIYDVEDDGPNSPATFNNNDGIGYFELASQDTGPFVDNTDADTETIDRTTLPFIKYNYASTDLDVYIKVDDWDVNGNGGIDTDDILLSQKVYVAIYWKEADKDRADTFITYISNPFYEKYK